MRILGIDPGTIKMGYGVIESQGDQVVPLDYGILKPPGHSSTGERLDYLYRGVLSIIRKNHPDAMSIEQAFVAKNVRSALSLGRAQAVAILAAASRNIPIFEYTPAEIKQQVASFGASSKDQVQRMVGLQLGLSELEMPEDASDALAVAICHISEIGRENRLRSYEREL